MFGTSVYAEYVEDAELEKQSTSIEKAEVTFDAYLDETNKKHQKLANIGDNLKLYLYVKVKSGYIENASVNMQGANFKLNTGNINNDIIERIDTENNIIYFNQLNKGKEFTLEIPIIFNHQDMFEVSNLSKENSIILTGNYVTESAKTVKIEKEIKDKIEWTSEAKVKVEQNLSKYAIVSNNTTTNGSAESLTKTLIQTVVKASLENNNLPVKETELKVTVPEINGTKPTEVSVIAQSTEATNGKDATDFSEENYSYNKDTGILTITVQNKEEQGKIAWKKNVQDEYHINYVYDTTTQTLNLIQPVVATIKTYGNEQIVSQTSNLTNNVSEKVGSVISNSIEFINKNLDKGYLYENGSYKQEYEVKLNQEIDYLEMLGEGLTIAPNIDKFVNKDETELDISSNVKILNLKINKENFDKILGTEGTIQVLKNGTAIETINKDTKLNDNNEYEINVNQNEITLVTSKPVTKGMLEITYKKQIDTLAGITQEQISNFSSLKTAAKVEILKTNYNIPTKEIGTSILLNEPVTKIETNIDRTSLSTVTENKDIKINVVLKNNDTKYDLYKNPVIQIEIPSYITNINIKNIELLYEEEMKLDLEKASQTKLENGNTLIQIPITGEQTKYHTNDITGGATIAINADFTIDKLTPAKEDLIKVYVTNEKSHSYENEEIGKAYQEINVKYAAPTGMVTVNKITMGDKTAMSISNQKETIEVATQEAAKTANVEMTIINNNTLSAKNISILGRVPSSNNKDITTGEDLESNFTANITGAISASAGITNDKITVYYSKNEAANKDLTDTNNNWMTNIDNFAEVKSYLVVLKDYEMKTGDTIQLNYPIQIPENLKHSQSTYATYVAYYNLVTEEGQTSNILETASATKTGIVTPQGADLEVTLNSNIADGQTVKEGQILQYTVTVKNISNVIAENVVANGNIPKEAIYVQKQENGFYKTDDTKTYVSQVYEKLNPQESQSFTYEVKVKNLNSAHKLEYDEEGNVTKDEYSISNYAEATAKELDNSVSSNIIKHYVEAGNLEVELKSDTNKNVQSGQEIKYTIKITNPTNEVKENVIVTANVPSGATFVEGQFTEADFKEDANNTYVLESNKKQIKWKVPSIISGDSEYITYTVVVEDNATQIKSNVEATCNNITTKSNEVTNTVKQLSLEATQSCDIDTNYISANDIITYTITVKNTGNDILRNVIITDNLPEELKCVGLSYTIGSKEQEKTEFSENVPTVHLEGIATGQSVIVKVKARVSSVEKNTKITNIGKITANDIEETKTNEITHTIKAGSTNGDNNNNNNSDGAYNITGTVWIDSNKNAQREDTESKVKDINVLLINKENGNILKESKTDESGKYEFTDLVNGEYIVVFMYDNTIYGITEYQKSGIETSKNSDATQVQINLNGENVIGAATDTLTIKDSNLYNIDLGLLQKEKFDLKLDKEITSITVQNKQGTKNYTYDAGTTMAKVDISPKYIAGTNVVITYKIKVTNEGDVAGYAKNIIDYLSSDVKFQSELNADWYQGKDGNIYTTSLANTLINPGETKEVILVVTKQMTEENVGLINNTAEIQESYNDYAISDIDSTPGNKVQTEDDYGKANVYLSLNTGAVATYTIITIIMISILGAGTYFLKKKVLKRI